MDKLATPKTIVVGYWSVVVKLSHNKAFKSDSQRLAVSLRSSIAKRRSHLNAALVANEEESNQISKFRANVGVSISSLSHLIF
ncbi:hypothetical protein F0231_20730 [Vibrio sp. RE86]|nr:hypothetical protein [Vibrio sp. RE86]